MTAAPRAPRAPTRSPRVLFALGMLAMGTIGAKGATGAIARTSGLLVAAPAPTVAPPLRSPLEIWGVTPDDDVQIDGARATVKGGSVRRTFSGDPSAANAPLYRELPPGKHAIVVARPGCSPMELAVDLQGSLKRSIVIAAPTTRCGVPLLPERAK